MTIYVGMTQDLASAKEFLMQKKSGMYPDVEMGPFTNKMDAVNYIKFMQNKFPDAIELDLPAFPVREENENKWWVFSFEVVGNVH